MTIIDAWIQHPTPEFLSHPIFESLLRWMGVDEPPEHFPIELTLGAMDAGGVDQALLSAWYGPDGALLTNDDVASHCEEHPERFVGIGSVNLSRPMEAVEQVRRCIGQLGFKGIRQLPWLWQLPPDDRRYYPVYATCAELGVPFCLQVGHTGPLMPSEYGRPIPYLDHVALDFPELTIVGGHIGYPWVDEMIALATKYENVFIDTSAYKPSRFPSQLVEFMNRHGRHKVLYGSNWPMISPQDCLDQVDGLGLDDEARELFLSGNAKRVFGL
jgi:predicted TIM-barrel fold metal-dependent hydrolase